ncbi:hypothetical protein [Anaerorhabdus sp.]|uniref:hypothetical protein n=1 Tax=Anaerorhabdus sp. TaxID=1872524 RepID=UPI002FCBE9E0
MQRYKSIRTIDDIETNLSGVGYRWIDESKVLFEQGSDFMLFIHEGELTFLLVNVTNGYFILRDFVTDEVIATHENDNFDEEEWYLNILNAIYKEECSA